MKTIEIKEVTVSDDIVKSLIEFSRLWEAEDSCFGYRANTLEDIEGRTVLLAYDNNKIIGYLFGIMEKQEKESTTIPKGSQCFEVEEIFVLPQYRSCGVGRQLFQYIENKLKSSIEYITLSTATKNYKSILHFYIEELDMTFWSARLFKKMDR